MHLHACSGRLGFLSVQSTKVMPDFPKICPETCLNFLFSPAKTAIKRLTPDPATETLDFVEWDLPAWMTLFVHNPCHQSNLSAVYSIYAKFSLTGNHEQCRVTAKLTGCAHNKSWILRTPMPKIFHQPGRDLAGKTIPCQISSWLVHRVTFAGGEELQMWPNLKYLGLQTLH